MIATPSKTAAKFREMAERLETEIAAKRGNRRENTPKRQKEAAVQRIDAAHLQRVKDALEKLADAAENEGIPEFLLGIKSKAQLMTMLRTRIDTSGGYYSVSDTGEYHDQSPEAVYLRAWMASKRSHAEKERDAEVARQSKIRDLEAQVKFSGIPGFFPTPQAVIQQMLDRAQIEEWHRVLEPSAGKGDIADELIKLVPSKQLDLIERNYTLTSILGVKGYNPRTADFLLFAPDEGYDRILMNPPFENGQDIDHVRHAHTLLKNPSSRLVAIMSSGAFHRKDRKATEFREWLDKLWHEVIDLGPDAFKSAFCQTGVSTRLVVIDK